MPAEHTIVIVWDSDAALNLAFAVCTRMLHDILRRRKCCVKIIVLPQTGTDKMGLDDYLVAYGKDAFEQLVNATAPLPVGRQIPIFELVISWLGSLSPALKSLSESEIKDLLSKSFRKGLIDRADTESRGQILKTLQQYTSVDVRGIFRASVLEFLKSNYGEAAQVESTTTVSVGCVATLPDEHSTRVRIVGVEDGFVWVMPAHGKKDWVTFPVPTGALKDVTAATNESGGQTAASFADDFIKHKHMKDGELALRAYRNVFFGWAEGTYTETPDSDILAEVMGFLRQKAPGLAIPKFQTSVIANLKSIGVCHVPSTAPLQPK